MIPGEWYTPAELHELPGLGQGQADEHVGLTDDGSQRVWYGRTEDSPAVSVETLTDRYTWETTYEGNPRRVRINFTNEVEVDE
jgi:hypothetical protein